MGSNTSFISISLFYYKYLNSYTYIDQTVYLILFMEYEFMGV